MLMKTFYSEICISVKDAYVQELEKNITFYKNAYVSSEKALTNIRALEAFLQTQVSCNHYLSFSSQQSLLIA